MAKSAFFTPKGVGGKKLGPMGITSESSRDPYDYMIKDWKGCNLLLPSCIRASKIATLGKQLVLKKLGRLGSPERRDIRSILKKLFKL